MSAISTDVSTLAGVLYNTQLTRQRLDILTVQGSSGLISSDFAGLGTAARGSLDLSGQIALNKASQTNASQAATVNQVAQTVLGQVQALLSTISSDLLGPSTSTGVGLSTLAATARSAPTQVAGLLNTKVGQVYVFAGQDSRVAPVPDADTITQSAFYTAIQTAVGTVSTSGSAAVQAQLIGAATAPATSPYSASLEASNQVSTADLGGGQTVQIGILADRNSDAVSAGTATTTTGSYMRDMLMSLATLSSLGTADPSDPQVQSLLSGVQGTLSGADDALNTDIGGLGARQATITVAQTDLTSTATALTTQLGNLQDADPATVATQLSTVQTQLQASYKIIADMEGLSLAKYL